MTTNISSPQLKSYMEKKVSLKLNGHRQVTGLVRGYDPFMNIVLDETVETVKDGLKNSIGMVVIRGNSINMLEFLEECPPPVVLRLTASSSNATMLERTAS